MMHRFRNTFVVFIGLYLLLSHSNFSYYIIYFGNVAEIGIDRGVMVCRV